LRKLLPAVKGGLGGDSGFVKFDLVQVEFLDLEVQLERRGLVGGSGESPLLPEYQHGLLGSLEPSLGLGHL